MSLEGNLTAFGLSEILQLIAVQQKSGMLSIGTQNNAKVLFFRDGSIVSTRDRRRRTKDPLRDYLTRYGIISRDDLIRLEQVSAASKLDLTEVLVSEGLLSEEEMQTHYRNHIQEEVHEILTWEQCSYKFIPGRDLVDGLKTWGQFNIEGMLMESMRRIDEFPAAEKLLPDLNSRISSVGEPKEDAELTTNEKTVRALLIIKDRTLGELIARAKMPRYEVYEAVRQLHEKDLVEIELSAEMKEQIEAEAQTKKKKPRRRPRKNPLPLMVSLLLFAASAAWGMRTVVPYIQSMAASRQIDTTSVARQRVETQIRWLLEAHFAEFGRYPQTLSILKKTGHVTDEFLDDVERHAFRYQLTAGGETYTLR
jgi:hypothetical protein